MRKDWLLNTFITFGLGWGLGIAFNPSNAPLSGLPAGLAAVSATAISQQLQRRRFQKSSASLRSQIARLQAKSHALQHNILTATTEQDQIAAQLDAYNQRRQAAEQHISALETARKRMTAEAQQVEEKLLSLRQEQADLEESIAQITTDRQQLMNDHLAMQAEYSSSKQELELERQELQAAMAQLQAEQQDHILASQQLTFERQLLLDEHLTLQSQVSSSHEELDAEQQRLLTAVDRLQAEEQQYISATQQLTAEIATLLSTKEALQRDREQLQQQIDMSQQLAVEVKAMSTDIWAEPVVPVTATIAEENWQDRFEDNAVRSVFEHLQEYGSVTETELTQMLEGNPRKARQFALKFEEYLQLVPFQARVEVAASGKRYVRD
jgi:chromosome segregation ATPase